MTHKLMLALALALVGCSEQKSRVSIPLNCINPIKITDFEKQCKPVHGHPDEATCDAVHIRFTCVAPVPDKEAHSKADAH